MSIPSSFKNSQHENWNDVQWILHSLLLNVPYMWIQSTVIHLPSCIASCIPHLPWAMGHCWRAWKCFLVSHWLSQRGNIFLSLREIRVKHYLWTESHGQRFHFLTDSNSHRLHQRFGGSRPSLVHLAFLELLVLQSIFFADRSTAALPSAGYHFLWRYRHQTQASLYQI